MEDYAASVGCDFFVPDESYFDSWVKDHPEFDWEAHHKLCWLKIPLLSSLLDEYDEVVWIDSDVVIVGTDNVFDDMSECPISLVVHEWKPGEIPNSGVWAVRKAAKEILDTIKIDPDIAKDAVWGDAIGYDGEQSMLLKRLGCNVNSGNLYMPPSDLWDELPYKYNSVFHDRRGVKPGAVFIHGCGPDPEFVFAGIVSSGVWNVPQFVQMEQYLETRT